jgi:glucose/arabinose dehydrogenase
MTSRWRLVALADVAACVALFAACGDDPPTQPAGAGPSGDAGVDGAAIATPDAAPDRDAGPPADASSGADASDAASQDDAASTADAGGDGGADAGDAAPPRWCDLPGSVVSTANGAVVVPGGSSPVDLSFLHVPVGFCVHYFGTVGNARTIRVAPSGELFVASPTALTSEGGGNGEAAIVVLPDDDRDGVADSVVTFHGSLPATSGLAFGAKKLVYQDGTTIRSVPYAPGDRAPAGAGVVEADITYYSSSLNWPKPIDVAADGTVYVGNSGDQAEPCVTPAGFTGGVRALDGTKDGKGVTSGLRKPSAVRCAPGTSACFGLEQAKSFAENAGGRDKLFAIQPGADLGFPCCATKDVAYGDLPNGPPPSCASVAPEAVSFVDGTLPTGLAFAAASWPAPFARSAIVSLHGKLGAGTGARLVAIATDPKSGAPLAGSDLPGGASGAMVDFATGWDDGTLQHGAPSSVDASSDGRLFVANDASGVIVWIAPL